MSNIFDYQGNQRKKKRKRKIKRKRGIKKKQKKRGIIREIKGK